MSLFGAAYAAPNKAPQFYTDLGIQKQLNPPINGKIQGLFKAFDSGLDKDLYQWVFRPLLFNLMSI